MTATVDFNHPSNADSYASGSLAYVLANQAAAAAMYSNVGGFTTINNPVDQMVRLKSSGDRFERFTLSGSTWADMPLSQILGFTAAPLASPTFTGVPAAPTATPGTNTTQLATTSFVATSFAPIASPAFTGTVSGAALNFSGILTALGMSAGATGISTSGGLTVSAGNLAVNSGSMSLNSAAGSFRICYFYTAASQRWALYADNTAEGGSNAGSNFGLNAYTDAGAFLSTPLTINRATGLTTLSSLTVSGAATFSSSVAVNANQLTITSAYASGAPLQVISTVNNGYSGGILMACNSTNYYQKLLRINDANGSMEWVNNALSAVILTLSDAGAVTAAGNVAAYGSDKRLKKNIKTIVDPMKLIRAVGGGQSFDWNIPLCHKIGFYPEHTSEHGLMAQDVRDAGLPEAVTRMNAKGNYLTIMYSKFIPFHGAALVEHDDRLLRIERQLGIA